MRKIILLAITYCFLMGLSELKAKDKKKDTRPNIIVILSDDVGFEEYGIYKVKKGEPSNTPNIDKLGMQGVTFKTAYAQAICGPSRAMLYSGNYAANNGAYDNKLYWNPEAKKGKMNLDQFPNFVKILHDAGYSTAVAGKWHNPIGGHLGINNELLGVDDYMVWYSDADKVEKITGVKLTPDEDWELAALTGKPLLSRFWKPAYIHNDKLLTTTMNDYGPDLLSDYICDYIKDNSKSEQPFLAFYSMVLAHSAHCVTPYEVEKGEKPSNEHFRKGTEKGSAIFKSQVRYADQLVAKIQQTVIDQGIDDNTIIIYASDNGTTASAKGKGVEYGVHVPFIVAGAGIKQRGMTDELIDFTDVLPTLADFAQTEIPSKYNVDGVSTKDFLTGKSDKTKEVMYAHPGVSTVIRTKDFMLEAVSPVYGYPKGRFYKTNGSYDGRGYENITNNPSYPEERARFEEYYQRLKPKFPESFDDPIWQSQIKKGYKFFNNEKRKKSHLSLPKSYQFYDPSF